MSSLVPGGGAERPIDVLLARPMSAAELERRTAAVAAPPVATDAAGETLLLMERAGELLALPAAAAARVVVPTAPHRVPHRAGPILRGVVNLRGELAPCVSLEAALGLDASAPPPAGAKVRFVALGSGPEAWVFEVDRVLGVRRVPRDEWRPPPATVGRPSDRITMHLVPCGDGWAALLDPVRLAARFLEGMR